MSVTLSHTHTSTLSLLWLEKNTGEVFGTLLLRMDTLRWRSKEGFRPFSSFPAFVVVNNSRLFITGLLPVGIPTVLFTVCVVLQLVL
jgi:hypothetical protein